MVLKYYYKISCNTRYATFCGFAAILLWGSTIALTRNLSTQIGVMTAAASVYSLSGILALLQFAISTEKRKQIRQLPLFYILGCGILFTSYMLMLIFAIGLANSKQQVLELGLVNYLWPVLTLLFSVVLLNITPKVIPLILGNLTRHPSQQNQIITY